MQCIPRLGGLIGRNKLRNDLAHQLATVRSSCCKATMLRHGLQAVLTFLPSTRTPWMPKSLTASRNDCMQHGTAQWASQRGC